MGEDDPRTGTRQPLGERPVSRRHYVRALAGGVTATTPLALASGAVAASEAHADAKPEDASITGDDTEWLERYRPLLDTRNVPVQNLPNLRGWKVTSDDPTVETDVGVYACEYAVQRDTLSLTSHAGDHEWIYVFVDSDSGEVQSTSYTAYHWLRGYVQDPPVFGGGDGGDHVQFLIAPTYHNYVPLPEPVDSSVLMDVSSLGDYESQSGPFYQWLDNGMSEDLAKGAVHNPWLLSPDGSLDAWWSREGSGRVNRWIVDVWAFLGLTLGVGWRGSDTAELGDADL